ncbi:hypothetical protein NQ314_007085 [Rhamnusium bicolor]|uniref:ZAD domain-containing protein n=1 Tax=Rhamnusium bicolor TaxID=1586634 RepID=A0AAV8YRV5_9CUCU|nr:hypothetical protein NQ314_007085 [Rhamnusium bicolor]
MANRLICRTCLKKERPEYCKNISPEQENEETSNILEMLNYCVPELDIHLVMNPVICRSCINMLETAFKFKTECLKIEEKFLKYSHSHSMNSKVCARSTLLTTIMSPFPFLETINVKAIKVERTSINDDHIDKLKDVKNKKVNNGKKTSKFSCAKCYGCEKKLTDPSYHSKLYQSPFKCYNCGKQVLSELAEEQIIKTEPEFIYANDNIHNLYKQEDFESEPRTTFDEEIDIVN